MSSIPIYMINLKSSNKSKKTFPQLKKYFKNTFKLNAINGNNIDLYSTAYTKKIHQITKYNIANNLKLNHKNIHNKGQVGCYLSHIKLWEKCVKLDKGILVMEDDVYINDFKEIDKVLKKIIPEYDYVSLIFLNLLSNTTTEETNYFSKLSDNHYGTQLYYISPKGAKVFLKYIYPILYQIDSYINIISHNQTMNSLYYNRNNINYKIIGKSNINYNFNFHLFLPHSNLFYIFIIILFFFLIFNYKRCSKNI